MSPEFDPRRLRSHRWFGPDDLRSFSHRSRAKQLGYSEADFKDRPVIAILNTWSDINPCHGHFRTRAEEVKRGVLQAGGFPVEMPALSLSEPFQKPTTMLYRNLLAMEAEELLRSYPVDGAVLMGGCDKTTPALIMGAASVDLPSVFVPAGPMLRGRWRGSVLGSGTDQWRYWADRQAGVIGDCEWREIEGGIARSAGHCMTMGTASTMTSVAETLGLALPGSASIPAVDSAHSRMAAESGRTVVELVKRDARPSTIVTASSFRNAVVAVLALGGSTNAVIHLIAMAGRFGIELSLDDFDALSRRVPILADVRPSGRHLMEDFAYAGGLTGLLSRLPDLLDLSRPTVAGGTLGDALSGAGVHDDDVIRPREAPLAAEGGIAVLRGNLAPDGCVIKHSAADPKLLRHTGPAVVFADYNDLVARIDSPDTAVNEDSVLVLRSAGPQGGPGMPEWGMLPIPKRLLRRGVRDMVRISDARMSGTSYGTCVLHVAPESSIGGPLALVRDGDPIRLDVPGRRLDLLVDGAELERRRRRWTPAPPRPERGYGALFREHVSQANKGCDFDFLARPGVTDEPEIH
ncbi:dihydroxy-acid dehydratase [Spinactinospora alkalitolerans]|uniref:Dihydroxy-acid dehydratase n=1 Tax=Spinactinospora alkalitolerans TaxID=687207 RepID=A0A852TZK1_9ACTN|nr:L-arabinonate dehydratase [Spinactinospora alkalitolerans]NYE48482.1 dihydroxy-acid dehydratase [Spinactinospora alkalitolerans]